MMRTRNSGAASRPGLILRTGAAALALALAAGSPAAAQQTPVPPAAAAGDTVRLSLEGALERAVGQSEEVRLARAQVELARAQVTAARSAALPQLNANLSYQRTFESPFGGGGISLPDSLRFEPDSTASLAERVRYLERNTPNAGLGGLGQLFGNLPFGQENTYVASLSGSQLLYSGGRVGAAMQIARDYRSAAELTLQEETSEIARQVRGAYYQALYAQELEAIAQAALEQAEAFLAQERVRLRSGRASELEVLRAEVSRNNLRPQLVQARNAAQVASLNLKRLVDAPMGAPQRRTTPLAVPSPEELAGDDLAPEVLTARRAAVAAAERQVSIREQQVRIARGAYLPSVSVQMNYGKQLQPSGIFALGEDWRTDWTAAVGVQVPVFDGFRRSAEVQTARVEAERARLQLSQLREAVQLEYEQARGERNRARAEISARQTNVATAQRVYDLTVLRYEQGLATQLEVSQARLELLQARTGLAQAISDFYVADAGVTRATGQTGTGTGTPTPLASPPAASTSTSTTNVNPTTTTPAPAGNPRR